VLSATIRIDISRYDESQYYSEILDNAISTCIQNLELEGLGETSEFRQADLATTVEGRVLIQSLQIYGLKDPTT
jgi:hypothetical protein